MTGEEDDNYDYLYKIVLAGDSGVGKTNLLSKFISNEFDPNSNSTIGVEFSVKAVKIADLTIKAQIWDTSGQERYRAITGAYYRGSVGALLVYDVTRRQSFQNITAWLKEVRTYADENIPLVLVGNKLDLAKKSRVVTTEEAKKYAQDNNMMFMEASALEGNNCENSFKTIIEHVCETFEQMKRKSQSNTEEEEKTEPEHQSTDNQPTEREKNLEEKVRSLEIYKKKYEEQEEEIKRLREQVEYLKIIKEQMEKNKEKDDMIIRLMQTIQSQMLSGEKKNTSLKPTLVTNSGSLNTEDNPENDICYDDPVDERNA